MSGRQEVAFCNPFDFYNFAAPKTNKNSRRQECHSEFVELTQVKRRSCAGCGENWGDLVHFSLIILLKDTAMGQALGGLA